MGYTIVFLWSDNVCIWIIIYWVFRVINNLIYPSDPNQLIGFSIANSIMGILSALIDNIPVMFSVLQMHNNESMVLSQWLLITLTAGLVEVYCQSDLLQELL